MPHHRQTFEPHLRKRHQQHVNASKQLLESEARSVFYSAFPGKKSTQYGGHNALGCFDQLRQVTGVRFSSDLKEKVAEMFFWDEHVESQLKQKEQRSSTSPPMMKELKNRMVCYFFEKMFDLMMSDENNLSSNPGFESFLGKWDGGHR